MRGANLSLGYVLNAHLRLQSVVINQLDIVGIAMLEVKADSPLTVYRDGVLPFSLAFKFMQTIAGRNLQVIKT